MRAVELRQGDQVTVDGRVLTVQHVSLHPAGTMVSFDNGEFHTAQYVENQEAAA